MVSPSRQPRWNRSDKRLLLQAFFLFPLFTLMLKVLGFRRSYIALNRLLASAKNSPVSCDQTLSEARHIAGIVKSANNDYSLFLFSCLPESLTLWYLLRRRKIAADLCLGVRTLTGPFESHAWVEYQRHVLNDIENVADIFTTFDLSSIIARRT